MKTRDASRQADAAKMLRECLSWAEDHEEEAEHRMNVDAFTSMLRVVNADRDLTEKQIAWIQGVYEKLFDAPQYENLFSSGKVPRGEKLATPIPEVLLRPLPKKPPGRRA